jgi:ferredoxin
MAVRPWPETLELRGLPGNYEALMKYKGHLEGITAGAVLVDVAELNRGGGATGLLERVTSRARNTGFSAGDILWETTLEGASGLFLLADGAKSPDAQRKHGLAAAARVAAYLEQEIALPRAMSVSINSRLCRGCGDCAAICPYIGLEEDQHGKVVAHVHDGLCFGCGACVSKCSTGAIKQPYQSDDQIVLVLRSILQHEAPKEVTGIVL